MGVTSIVMSLHVLVNPRHKQDVPNRLKCEQTHLQSRNDGFAKIHANTGWVKDDEAWQEQTKGNLIASRRGFEVFFSETSCSPFLFETTPTFAEDTQTSQKKQLDSTVSAFCHQKETDEPQFFQVPSMLYFSNL